MVTPRFPLPLQIEHPVDRVLHGLRRDRRDEGDLVGHGARRRRRAPPRGTTLLTSPNRSASCGLDRLRAEQELLGLARSELPRLDQELDGGARHAQHGVGELRIVGGDDEIAHARQHQAGGGARALHGGDRGLAEVADPHAAVEVHDLLVAELALGRVAQLRPLVALREELLEVVTGGEVLALAGQHHDPDLVVRVGAVEGGVELVDELAVLCVGGVGAVECDRAHRPVDLVADRLERPRLS